MPRLSTTVAPTMIHGIAGMLSASGRTMTDEKSKRGRIEYASINLKEKDDVRYWAAAFGITAERLRQVVGQVGSSAEAVRRKLSN